ncbi:hypothetical protein [Yinghuangia sp. YIM S10712]|uniref:hypothetical protein n=1 Tax=Yinghuangia sp. YIM S10712 TaxID=3436930 RepID=UPI003F530EAA
MATPLHALGTPHAIPDSAYWDVDTEYPLAPGPGTGPEDTTPCGGAPFGGAFVGSRQLGRPVAELAAFVSGSTEHGFDDVMEPDHDLEFFREHRSVWAQKHGLLTEVPPPDAFSDDFHASMAKVLAVSRPLLHPAITWGWLMPTKVMADVGIVAEQEARDWCASDLLTIMDYTAMATDSEVRRTLLEGARAMAVDGVLRLPRKWLDYANVVVCRAGRRGIEGRCAAKASMNVPLFDRGVLSDVEVARWAMVDMGLPNWLRRSLVCRENMALIALPRLTNDMSDLMTDVLRGEPGNMFRLRRDLRLWFAHYSAWLRGRWDAVRTGTCDPVELAAAITMPYTFLGRRARTWTKLAVAYRKSPQSGPSACPWCGDYASKTGDFHRPFSVRPGASGPRGGAERTAVTAVSTARKLVTDCGATVREEVWEHMRGRVERLLADAPAVGDRTSGFHRAFGTLYGVLSVPILLMEGGHLDADTVHRMELVAHEYVRYDITRPAEMAAAVYYAMVVCHPHPTMSLGTLETGLLYGRPLAPDDVPLDDPARLPHFAR